MGKALEASTAQTSPPAMGAQACPQSMASAVETSSAFPMGLPAETSSTQPLVTQASPPAMGSQACSQPMGAQACSQPMGTAAQTCPSVKSMGTQASSARSAPTPSMESSSA